MEQDNKFSISKEVAFIVGLACLALALNYFQIEIKNDSASQNILGAVIIIFEIIIALKFLLMLITIFGIMRKMTTDKRKL